MFSVVKTWNHPAMSTHRTPVCLENRRIYKIILSCLCRFLTSLNTSGHRFLNRSINQCCGELKVFCSKTRCQWGLIHQPVNSMFNSLPLKHKGSRKYSCSKAGYVLLTLLILNLFQPLHFLLLTFSTIPIGSKRHSIQT